MMIPWVVVLTVVVIGAAELGETEVGAEAAEAGPERASAATTAVQAVGGGEPRVLTP
jgi:hypothetical protein